MNSVITQLTSFGSVSLLNFWYPIILWTLISALTLLILKFSKQLHHSFQYSIRIAILYSLPVGLLMIHIVSFSLIKPENIETISTIIYLPTSQPIEAKSSPQTERIISQPLTVDFWIGSITTAVIIFSLFRFIYFISQYIGLHRFKSFLPQITDKDILSHLADLSAVMQINRNISVYSASDKNVPMTFGYWKPVIIIPSSLHENRSRLVAALTHECIHIANNDYVFKLWEEIFHSLFFFNPLVGILTDQIEKYREISCDSEVISKEIIMKADYAKLLVEMTQISQAGNEFSLGITYSNIKERILAMQNRQQFEVPVYIKVLSFSLFFSMLVGVSFLVACTNMYELVESANINGMWTGKMIQPLGPQGQSGYDMEINLVQNDSIVTGTSKIFISGTEFYAIMQLEGKFKSDSLYFEEVSFLENKPRPNLFWCLKKGILYLNRGNKSLNGEWSNNNCLPGTINLTKRNNQSVQYKSQNNYTVSKLDSIYDEVDIFPEPIGGYSELFRKLKFPEEAKKENNEGFVLLKVAINKDGDILKIITLKSSSEIFEKNAINSIQNVKFTSAILNQQKVNCWIAIPIKFK